MFQVTLIGIKINEMMLSVMDSSASWSISPLVPADLDSLVVKVDEATDLTSILMDVS